MTYNCGKGQLQISPIDCNSSLLHFFFFNLGSKFNFNNVLRNLSKSLATNTVISEELLKLITQNTASNNLSGLAEHFIHSVL